MPQSAAAISRSRPACGKARRIRSATAAGVSTSSVERSRTPRMIVFADSACRSSSARPRLRGLDTDLVALRRGELGQERIAAGPVVDDRGVPEADVDRRRAGDAVGGAAQDVEAEVACGLGTGLHVGLIDLDHVGSGLEEVADLPAHRVGVRHRELVRGPVVVVLGLLGHRDRPRHRELRPAGSYARAGTACHGPAPAGRRATGATTRGTGLGCPLRSSAVPGFSMSTPSSAVAKRFE